MSVEKKVSTYVVDGDTEDRARVARCNRHAVSEIQKEFLDWKEERNLQASIDSTFQLTARTIKGRLCYRVILWVEMKVDNIANYSSL